MAERLTREQLLNLEASLNASASSGIKFDALLHDPSLMSLEQIQNMLSSEGVTGEGARLLLVLDDSTMSFSDTENGGANYRHSVVISPTLWYENGRTHRVYQGIENGRLYIVSYDERYGLSRPIGFHGMLSAFHDAGHHLPTLITHNNTGYIASESRHNLEPIAILKARTAGDFMLWDRSSAVIGDFLTYPNLYEKNGMFLSVGQSTDVEAAFSINTSGDFEGTWSTEDVMTTRAANEDEHYVSYILNADNLPGTKIPFIVSGRNDDILPDSPWFRKYLIKVEVTAEGITYYNWDESFSKSTKIGTVELDTYFKYYAGASDEVQTFQPVAGVDNDGNFYDVTGDGSGGYEFIYLASGASTPTIKSITLPDSPTLVPMSVVITGSGQSGACVLVLPISTSEVYAFFRIQSGDYAKIFRYKTTDLGDTWTNEGDVFADVNGSIAGIGVPRNIGSIENNKNFIIAGSLAPSTTSDPTTIYFKKAAFGSIQVETGDPFNVTAYTESEYDALMRVSLYAEAGKLTNTGTGVTGVTDQSPDARTITVVGSPTLDNDTTPSYMTFDGTNDALSINVTGLPTESEGTIFIVAKGRVGANSAFMTASNNTSTSEYISFGKSNTEKTRYNDSNTTAIVNGKTTVTDAFHIFAFTLQNDRGSEVLQWLDGEMQLRDVVTAGTEEGGFFNRLGGMTHLEVGRLVRTTTSWHQHDIKHIAVATEPLDFSQMCKAFKYLSDKYSITLNSHFQ